MTIAADGHGLREYIDAGDQARGLAFDRRAKRHRSQRRRHENGSFMRSDPFITLALPLAHVNAVFSFLSAG
jgi:hypothetical protein